MESISISQDNKWWDDGENSHSFLLTVRICFSASLGKQEKVLVSWSYLWFHWSLISQWQNQTCTHLKTTRPQCHSSVLHSTHIGIAQILWGKCYFLQMDEGSQQAPEIQMLIQRGSCREQFLHNNTYYHSSGKPLPLCLSTVLLHRDPVRPAEPTGIVTGSPFLLGVPPAKA